MKPYDCTRWLERKSSEAIAYYNDARRADWVTTSEDEVETALTRIGRQPKASSAVPQWLSEVRAQPPTFPYVIFYYEYEDHVWVASVYHTSREPDTWMRSDYRKRIGDSNGRPTA